MLHAKMRAPHIKLCIPYSALMLDVTAPHIVSSSDLMLDGEITAPDITLLIVFGSNVRRKNDGSTY